MGCSAKLGPGSSRCARLSVVWQQGSVSRLVLGEIGLELLHRRIGIDADLLDVVGPRLLERRRGLFPFGELRRGELIDLVAGLRLDLGDAGVLEVRPRTRDL